jgi:predicted DNA-binding protein (MmcQ/YjbR family)|tara:strand:- start:69 stop:254 length:186 start_codon:yes stop_codon:yes gene_type:complete
MFAAIKLAMRYSDVLPIAIDLVKEIEISVRDDGTISKDERSKLLKRFWNLVRAVQAPKKAQ